jgi:hypothetical protein
VNPGVCSHGYFKKYEKLNTQEEDSPCISNKKIKISITTGTFYRPYVILIKIDIVPISVYVVIE